MDILQAEMRPIGVPLTERHPPMPPLRAVIRRAQAIDRAKVA